MIGDNVSPLTPHGPERGADLNDMNCVQYLDWYFHSDDGMADKDAADAWENIKGVLETLKEIVEQYKTPTDQDEWDDYDHCYECRGLGDDYIINDDGELESFCDRCGCNPNRREDNE